MELSIEEIADRLEIQPSVVENYYEEWSFKQDSDLSNDHYEGTFVEYMCDVFAEAAFLMNAIENKGDAVDCLEAFDEAYTLTQEILEQ